ncbi:MAG: AI-2E family transporter [Gemmatimonadota bacterium]
MTAPATARRGISLVGLVLAALLLALLYVAHGVLLVIFLAILLGVSLDALAGLFERRLRFSKPLSLTAAVVCSLGVAVGVFFIIVPVFADQVRDLISGLPQFISTLDKTINGLVQRVPVIRRGLATTGQSGILANALGDIFGYLQSAVIPSLRVGFEVALEGISVVVMAMYLARHPALYTDGVIALVPPPRRRLAREILLDLGLTLRAWVFGQIVAMTVLGALTTLGLWILGVPYFVAFGVFAGLAAIVPFFGVLLSTALPALYALGDSGVTKALLVAGLGVLVHLFEANFLSPKVMERQVNLPPVITIAGVLLIGSLLGLLGLLVAVPILAVIMVLIRHILIGEVYGDPIAAVLPSGTVPSDSSRTIAHHPPSP